MDDLINEEEEKFYQVMNTFDEARRTGDPLRYDREVSQGIRGYNKARERYKAKKVLRSIDRNSLDEMEEEVKKETRRFCTNALQKLKEEKHKEMTEKEEATKHKRPPEDE